MYIPYTSPVIGRIYNGSVIQYWRSCTPSRSIGECAVPDLNAILCFLWFTNCVLLFDNKDVFVPGPSLRILDSTRYQRTPLCHILLLNLDILQGSFRLCNWLSLRRLVSWINHLPPACWSTFRKSNSKQQLGCRFDMMDYESYFFVFWHMQLYMSWYIISFFGFTLLNILHFFKYSCTNIFL